MNSRGNKFIAFNFTALALLATVLLASRGAAAKDHKGSGQARVVAHISFPGLSALDLAMQSRANDKVYLYVQHAESQGISVIDISKPAAPKNLGRIPWPDRGMSSSLNVTGDLALIAETGDLPAHSSNSNDDLVVWDLSNPAAPRVVQKFPGVVKWLEGARNLVYVLNGDGLWVVSGAVERQAVQTVPGTDGASW